MVVATDSNPKPNNPLQSTPPPADQAKSGINGTSLRATLHLFRFDLDPREAPRKPSPYFAFDCPLLVPRSSNQTAKPSNPNDLYPATKSPLANTIPTH
jgi:hypothetical protein